MEKFGEDSRQVRKHSARQQTLVFLHMPKAAGSTLNQIVQRQYDPDTVFNVYVGDEEIEDEIKQLPLERRKRLRVLSAHMPFGLHELLPQPSTYVTVLRDPIDRLISFYYYILRSPDNDHYQFVTSHQLSLKEYILSGILPSNGQTRRLAGIAQPSRQTPVYDRPCSEEDLQLAKRNLREHFAVVGLSERFDETLLLLKKAFGWKAPFYVKTNVTRNRPTKEGLPEETLRVLQEHVALDVELHRYAEQIFEEQISQQGTGFERELATFRLLNGFYGIAHSFSRPIRHAIKGSLKWEGGEAQ